MKYLLDAPDAEMAEWRTAAKQAGVTFAEWWRELARRECRGEAVVGAFGPGPSPHPASPSRSIDVEPTGLTTPSPPTPDLSVGNAVVGGAAPMSGRVFRGPDPKPTAKERKPRGRGAA